MGDRRGLANARAEAAEAEKSRANASANEAHTPFLPPAGAHFDVRNDRCIEEDCTSAIAPTICGVRRQQKEREWAQPRRKAKGARAGLRGRNTAGPMLHKVLCASAGAAAASVLEATTGGDPIQPNADNRRGVRGGSVGRPVRAVGRSVGGRRAGPGFCP